jgi:hypothetical protein
MRRYQYWRSEGQWPSTDSSGVLSLRAMALIMRRSRLVSVAGQRGNWIPQDDLFGHRSLMRLLGQYVLGVFLTTDPSASLVAPGMQHISGRSVSSATVYCHNFGSYLAKDCL